jgi:hypothetical protein
MYAPREMFCLVACLFLTKVVNILNCWMIQFGYVVNKVLMVPIFLAGYFTLPTISAFMICTPLLLFLKCVTGLIIWNVIAAIVSNFWLYF